MSSQPKSGMMPLTQLAGLVNEAISLRKPHKDTIKSYAEKMSVGTEFPPIVIGQWPKSDKYGDSGIVDGLHRLAAASEAKLKEFPIQIVQYDTLELALADMYARNMQHGLPPTDGQRNARIKLLKQINPNETIDTLGKKFGLNRSSIDRILKGKQGEGKSGRKGGANASASHKTLEPLKPKSFFSSLDRLEFTLSRVRPVADIITFCAPQVEDGVTLDKEKKKKLESVMKLLQGVLVEINKIGVQK